MNIPKLTGVVDLVALQNAITLLLCDDIRLVDVPILPEIKLQQESELQVDIMWTLPRSAFIVTPSGVTIGAGTGPVGAGILVEMPGAKTSSPGVSGPPTDWEINVVAFEERNTNLTPNVGIGLMSEQIAQIVKDILQLQNFGTFASSPWGFGTLRANASWLNPAHDWMQIKPGIVAYRVSFTSTSGVKQTPRSQPVVVSFNTGMCTLTCSDILAAVYYTLDGSLPVKANPNAKPYSAPFSVNSGQQVLAASRRTGFISSEIWGNTAP